MYKPLEVLGPEHEYSLVDENLKPLPISDQIIKGYCGRTVNFIELTEFHFGKELQTACYGNQRLTALRLTLNSKKPCTPSRTPA